MLKYRVLGYIVVCGSINGVAVLDMFPQCKHISWLQLLLLHSTENSSIDGLSATVYEGDYRFHWLFYQRQSPLQIDESCCCFPPPKERNKHKDARRRTTTKDPGRFGRGQQQQHCGMCNSLSLTSTRRPKIFGAGTTLMRFTKLRKGPNKLLEKSQQCCISCFLVHWKTIPWTPKRIQIKQGIIKYGTFCTKKGCLSTMSFGQLKRVFL